ncbi:MAG TPA: molecular chaperone TorD family protein [Aestuariivirga sp.]|nr:molecular chaperone TorD family protein [Aestuariivirga sp.]
MDQTKAPQEQLSEGAAETSLAASADLALLCRLHDREPTPELLLKLKATAPDQWFGLNLDGPDAQAGFSLLDDFFATVTPDNVEAVTEDLAVNYADLYLTFTQRIAPNESHWLTEDHLERQQPMFEVREWYEHYGLKASDWRNRADDHLVHQLEFVAALLRHNQVTALIDAGKFMDRHLLVWSRMFLGGMAQKSESPFYAALGLLTEAVLQATRDFIAAATGAPRETFVPKLAAQAAEDDGCAPYVPGTGPGW